MMERRNSGKIKVKRDANGRLVQTFDAQVKVKRDANGDLVQIGGDKETVRVKASSRHGIGTRNLAGAGLGVHHLIKDASGRLIVCVIILVVFLGVILGVKRYIL